jgi:hypothetical protein
MTHLEQAKFSIIAFLQESTEVGIKLLLCLSFSGLIACSLSFWILKSRPSRLKCVAAEYRCSELSHSHYPFPKKFSPQPALVLEKKETFTK